MRAIDVRLSGTPEFGMSRELFKTRLVPNGIVDQYAVTPDGRRFLIMSPVGDVFQGGPPVSPAPITNAKSSTFAGAKKATFYGTMLKGVRYCTVRLDPDSLA